MTQTPPVFAGRVPEQYDRYMGPIFFEQYAKDLAARLPVRPGMRVLELACGTGIVTRQLRDALPADASLVATDLNPPMIAQAATKFRSGESIEFRQADATRLAFADGAFDAVICQFGAMFFPDKAAAFREAFRVLAAGGVFLFSVWDALEKNELSLVATRAIAAFFPSNPPDFYQIPFGFHNRPEIAAMISAAGFDAVELTTVVKPAIAATAHDAAVALVEGTPMIALIAERGADPEEIVNGTARAIRERFGDHPVSTVMTAIVCTARKPAA